MESINFELLDTLGSSYVIDHGFAQYRKDCEDRLMKVYVTDSLKIIAENIANIGGGKTMSARYTDIIDRKPADKRTADDIISNIKNKLSKGDEQQ